MTESCWISDDFQNVKLLFKLAFSCYTFGANMFRICMENMSKQLPFYKEALIKAVSMISKVIDHPNLENKLNNILDMLSGINTSLFGRSEERVTNCYYFC